MEQAGALEGRKILLVEDEAANRAIAGKLLRAMGGEVVAAQNGRAGVEAFLLSRPGEFSLILMDLRMPVLDGWQAAREIRRTSREDAGSVPILAVTAETGEEALARCLLCGMNGYLEKPYSRCRFQEMVLSVLRP